MGRKVNNAQAFVADSKQTQFIQKGCTPLTSAAARGDHGATKALIKAQVDVNLAQKVGATLEETCFAHSQPRLL
jgi:hypothetical protein